MHPQALLMLLMLATAGSAPASQTTPAVDQVSTAADTTTRFFIDGAEILATDVALIDADLIAGVEVVSGVAASTRYGAGTVRAVEIRTTAAQSQPPASVVFMLDEREIPPQLAHVLDREKIGTVEVLKGAVTRLYGERAQNGVVRIARRALPQ